MTALPIGRFRTLAVVALAVVTVSACSSTSTPSPTTATVGTPAPNATQAPAATPKPVTITVSSLLPGSTQSAFDAFNLRVNEFEAQYPWITVQGQEYQWLATTFTAALAAGTLPDVFTIPFTDGKGLIAQQQIVNIDSRVRAIPDAAQLNPNLLVNGQDSTGKIFAVPTAAYGMSLTYNRTLFTKAGLDPDKPPTTWDEVQADAKIIAQKDNVAGFAQMATQNTGGWQLSTLTYALGGRLDIVGSDGKVTATVNNQYTIAALQWLQQLRWTDDSMGSTFDYNWSTINQAFAAGQVGMFLGGSDLYTTMIQNDNLNPADYGITTVPLASVPTAALMGGGTLAAVNVNTTEAQRDAAVDWINYYYLGQMTNQADAVANAKALQDNKQPVGVPALPIFTKTIYDQDQTWIASYINVPTAQMAPFLNNIFSQPLDSEPAASTQTLYSLLDPVVQAVLTNKNADITSLLNAANKQVQTAIDKGE